MQQPPGCFLLQRTQLLFFSAPQIGINFVKPPESAAGTIKFDYI
jgi:hypothetical protein